MRIPLDPRGPARGRRKGRYDEEVHVPLIVKLSRQARADTHATKGRLLALVSIQ